MLENLLAVYGFYVEGFPNLIPGDPSAQKARFWMTEPDLRNITAVNNLYLIVL